MIMVNKCLLLLLLIVLSACLAGCTTTQATGIDSYGDYLVELNYGNADCVAASRHYDQASNNFSLGAYARASNAITLSRNEYAGAMQHYGNMTGFAADQGQRDYADALYYYAQNCMYASTSYKDAYQEYAAGRGDLGYRYTRDAESFIQKANEYHDRAVDLQPKVIR